MSKGNLSEVRRQRGLSVEQVARQGRVVVSTIKAIEAGRYVPTFVTARRLAKIYNVRLDDFLGRESPSKPLTQRTR